MKHLEERLARNECHTHVSSYYSDEAVCLPLPPPCTLHNVSCFTWDLSPYLQVPLTCLLAILRMHRVPPSFRTSSSGLHHVVTYLFREVSRNTLPASLDKALLQGRNSLISLPILSAKREVSISKLC